MDKLADELLNTPPLDSDFILTNKFNDMALHWCFLYKGFDNFMDAYYKSQKRVLAMRRGQPSVLKIKANDEPLDELTDKIKRQVLVRDKFTCVCCGKEKRRGIVLNVDHIHPVAMGGKNLVSNLQTLCKQCNALKGVNEINYRVNTTPLRQPKSELKLFDFVDSDDLNNVIARIINEFYHCKALYELHYHERGNGQFYKKWEIILYSGNNPDWLLEKKKDLLRYIKKQLGKEHVTGIIIKS